MTIEYNGVKMVPMMKDNRDILSVPRLLRAAPSGGFKYYVHYANDMYGSVNTINVKEIWPNAFNWGMDRHPGGMAEEIVGNIGTLLYIPSISYMPSAGHINGTGNVRAESASYSNDTFTIKTLGMSSAVRLVQYTQTPEVSWPYNEKWRLQTDGSFYDNDLYEFRAFAYILLNVYNMDLSLGSSPFRWNVYSKYKDPSDNIVKSGDNICRQSVTAQKVIDGASYETWLIKSKKESSSGYLLKQDNPSVPNYPNWISNLEYIEFPQLKINVTENTGWFQVTAMGMEFWCYNFPPT